MPAEGMIYAFINFQQAARFGHVGWGFALDRSTYVFGSTDHLYRHKIWDLAAWLKYMAVPPGEDLDWWCETGSEAEMLTAMRTGHHPNSGRHLCYHAYKVLGVPQANPQKARHTAESQRYGGWRVLDHNCVHHAYRIFADYGAANQVPNPADAPLKRVPKIWFSLLEGNIQYLSPEPT